MILVLLGTQNIPFHRIIEEIIELKQQDIIGTSEKIIIQAGSTQVPPCEGIEAYTQLIHSEYKALIEQADLVITHGGAGSVFDAMNQQKKIIALPRLFKYNEHVDDHQIELVTKLAKENYILGEQTLAESFKLLETFHPRLYQSKQQDIIQVVRDYINE